MLVLGMRAADARFMMRRFSILILILALACPVSEARFFKLPGASAAVSITARRTARTAKKKPRRIRVRKRKSTARRIRVRVQSAPDWDTIMRRNSQPETGALLPEEYEQWLKNFTDAELDYYLKSKIADAIPLPEVERIAKKRGVR